MVQKKLFHSVMSTSAPDIKRLNRYSVIFEVQLRWSLCHSLVSSVYRVTQVLKSQNQTNLKIKNDAYQLLATATLITALYGCVNNTGSQSEDRGIKSPH